MPGWYEDGSEEQNRMEEQMRRERAVETKRLQAKAFTVECERQIIEVEEEIEEIEYYKDALAVSRKDVAIWQRIIAYPKARLAELRQGRKGE